MAGKGDRRDVYKRQPVDKKKCKVFLGEDFAFVLYKSEAARFHIEEENDLSEQTYEKIKEEILSLIHI